MSSLSVIVVRGALRMESIVRVQLSIPIALWASFSLIALSNAHAIENDPGKAYHLTDKHGPWMVMVAMFAKMKVAKPRDFPRKKLRINWFTNFEPVGFPLIRIPAKRRKGRSTPSIDLEIPTNASMPHRSE